MSCFSPETRRQNVPKTYIREITKTPYNIQIFPPFRITTGILQHKSLHTEITVRILMAIRISSSLVTGAFTGLNRQVAFLAIPLKSSLYLIFTVSTDQSHKLVQYFDRTSLLSLSSSLSVTYQNPNLLLITNHH